MSKVSVIIPVYNTERYILRCLKSVLSQSLVEIEIIVVNDGSIDGSMDIVRKLANEDPRIIIINNVENHGVMWAKSDGFKRASGNYIVFVDSDDELPEDALQILYDQAEATNSDIVAGTGKYIRSDGRVEMWTSCCYGDDSISLYKALLKNEFRHTMWGKIFSARLFQSYKYHVFKNFNNYDDYCYLYQIASNVNKVSCIDVVVYNYYENAGSLTKKSLNVRQLETNIISHRLVYDELSSIPEFTPLLYSNFQRNFIRQYALGYKKPFKALLKKYNLEWIVSARNILKYNNVYVALTLLIGKSLFGRILFNMYRK